MISKASFTIRIVSNTARKSCLQEAFTIRPHHVSSVSCPCTLMTNNDLLSKKELFSLKQYSHHNNILRPLTSSRRIEKDNIFISINHAEKVRENDGETDKLLDPLRQQSLHKNGVDEHQHEHEQKNNDDDDDEMEKEDMFVAPDMSLGHDKIEWGGPRRGGRYAEPTRFGDWERKGRCTDF